MNAVELHMGENSVMFQFYNSKMKGVSHSVSYA